MSDYLNIADFLSPISKAELSFDQGYKEGQLGNAIKIHDDESFPDVDEADLIIIGCGYGASQITIAVGRIVLR